MRKINIINEPSFVGKAKLEVVGRGAIILEKGLAVGQSVRTTGNKPIKSAEIRRITTDNSVVVGGERTFFNKRRGEFVTAYKFVQTQPKFVHLK
jgi:hypothetical protein